MKKNNLLKVFSAAVIVSTLSVTELSNVQLPAKVATAAENTPSSAVYDIPVKLMNYYTPNKLSMGNAAMVKATVQKVGNQFKYTVILKDITFLGMSDGIRKFWVEGKEIPLKSITYPDPKVINPVQVEFTSPALKSSFDVEVFVNAMEQIMPGGGRQKAKLTFDTSKVPSSINDLISEETKTEEIPYKTTKVENPNLEKGTEKVKTPGKKGVKTVVYTVVTKADGTQTKTVKSEAVTQQPVNEVIEVGTKVVQQKQPQKNMVTYFDNVTVKLMHAYEQGRPSMGNPALDGIVVYKDGDTYHYIVKFKDLTFPFGGKSFTDGIKRFWVKGVEYPVTRTGGPNNQVQVHFTSKEKLTNVPVAVYVQTMENIMPGGGKQNAILAIDWSKATERQGEAPVGGGEPGGGSNNGILPRTGLETSSSLLAGAITLMGAVLLGRRKQK
ncbi:LPXTG-motif protein cell wall anchor domain protein [Gemella bergeri ATCC 700627]|uniref:LPXTG-motif protein cell wall anchor domain protein n=1 Tax=Gemella bergeri ATCC 700627 TaxID=1321820 RepID=U2QM70_9BACL|nr:G5 domain-containing protein [Gemella bergeri]ERK57606.1 LPXTG-motif protein cell wall anchor domain protein [Gemella bergeri ATCC 700627]